MIYDPEYFSGSQLYSLWFGWMDVKVMALLCDEPSKLFSNETPDI